MTDYMPDKVRVTAYYDEVGRLHNLEMAINTDLLTRDDVASLVEVALRSRRARPRVEVGESIITDVTQSDPDSGVTRILPAVTVNMPVETNTPIADQTEANHVGTGPFWRR